MLSELRGLHRPVLHGQTVADVLGGGHGVLGIRLIICGEELPSDLLGFQVFVDEETVIR